MGSDSVFVGNLTDIGDSCPLAKFQTKLRKGLDYYDYCVPRRPIHTFGDFVDPLPKNIKLLMYILKGYRI